MRALTVALLAALTACGGKDGPTAPPASIAIAAVRAESPVWQRDTVTFTARNVGRSAQWRVSAWADNAVCALPGCDAHNQCQGAAALINASASIRLNVACNARSGFDWIVIETQDPGSPVFQRTACVSRVGDCPVALRPER